MWVYFTIGRGPGECQIACSRLAARFIAEAVTSGARATMVDAQRGPHGLFSALVAVEGDVEPLVASWEGTLQWTCPSPIRKGWGRKNWYISASVIRPPPPAQGLRESDLQFQTYRASGPGGQHMQKTDSAVRVTHKPTGLIAHAQEERSQHRNKALATARLAALLAARATAADHAVEHEKWTKHDSLERGNPVRVFRGPEFNAC
jgi:peptide chain release factor